MTEISGRPNAAGLKIGIIVSRFNEDITRKLLDGAIEALKEHGAISESITVVWVPGCFEIPLALAGMADKNFDAVVCLGVVIRGETSHYDFVAGEAARGIASISVAAGLPVGFGVVTTENTDQALARSGGNKGNKGREAAMAAMEMADAIEQIKLSGPQKGI